MKPSSKLDAGFVFAPYIPIMYDENAEVLSRIDAYFAYKPIGFEQELLQAAVGNPGATSGSLHDALLLGTWDIGSAVLQHPNIAASTWRRYAWLDPSSALQNVALSLWLLEDPDFFITLEPGVLRVLLTSPYLTGAILMQLIEQAWSEEGVSPTWVGESLLSVLATAAGITPEHEARIAGVKTESRVGFAIKYGVENLHTDYYAIMSITSIEREPDERE